MMKQGEGSITKVASGFWVRGARALGRPSLGVYPTEAEARGVLDHARHELASGEYETAGGMTFVKLGERVLADRELCGVRGIASERRRFNRHLSDAPFASDPVAAITPQDILQLLRQLAAKTAADKRGRRRLSKHTVQRCMSLCSVIFAEALTLGIRPDNPCAGLRVGKRLRVAEEDVTEKWDFLRLEEQRANRRMRRHPEWARLMIQIAWLTGLRQGEMWNLELRDVHVEGARPHIFVRFGSKGHAPKNGKTRRVPLLPEAVATVKSWLVELKKYAPKNPTRLAFPGPTGARRQPGAPERSVRKILKGKRTCGKIELLPVWLLAAGITRSFRWHDLRHTCGSSLVAGWWGRRWSLLEVRDLLGHRDVSVTQKYAHLAESELDRAARNTSQVGSGRVMEGGPSPSSIAAITNDLLSVGPVGLEPTTYGLKVRSSTN